MDDKKLDKKIIDIQKSFKNPTKSLKVTKAQLLPKKTKWPTYKRKKIWTIEEYLIKKKLSKDEFIKKYSPKKIAAYFSLIKMDIMSSPGNLKALLDNHKEEREEYNIDQPTTIKLVFVDCLKDNGNK